MPDEAGEIEPNHKVESFNPMNMFALDFKSLSSAPDMARVRPVGDFIMCLEAFNTEFERPGLDIWPSHIVPLNRMLLEVFSGEELLDLPGFVTSHARIDGRRVHLIDRQVRPDPDPRAYGAAGSFARQCLMLRLIAVEKVGKGETRFQLLDREPQFAIEGRKVVRIRGLTPAEQVQRDRQTRMTARRNDKADRKARDLATPIIGRMINELVRLDRRHTVPEYWYTEGFLPADLVGRGVAETSAFIVEYHHVAALDRARLARWQACLMRSVQQAAWQAPLSKESSVREGVSVHLNDEAALMTLSRFEDV